jgi:hypothetical protein
MKELDTSKAAVRQAEMTKPLPHTSLPQWKVGTCLGAGYFCQITGLSNVMFDLHDGTRLRLLLDRAEATELIKALQATLAAPQAKVNLPHWVISSLIPRSPGFSTPGHSHPPLEISSTATSGEG